MTLANIQQLTNGFQLQIFNHSGDLVSQTIYNRVFDIYNNNPPLFGLIDPISRSFIFPATDFTQININGATAPALYEDFIAAVTAIIFFLPTSETVAVDNVTIEFNAEDKLSVKKVDGDFQNILLKKSSSAAVPAPVLPFGTPYLLSTLDGKDKLFIGDRAGLNSLLNVPPIAKIYNKTFATPVVIAAGATYNLMTSLLNTDVPANNEFNLEDLSTKFSINSTQVSIQFPPLVQYCQYSIRVILRGSLSGSSSTNRQFGLQLRRGADNSSITEQIIVRVEFTDLANLGLNFNSFTNGVLDPFSQLNNGLRIVVNNTETVTITLTGFQILIQGNPTNLKQI